MAHLSFYLEDVPRFLGALREPDRRLIRPTDVVDVCRTALALRSEHGILKAIPLALEKARILERSEKERAAYHRLLVELLTKHRRRNPPKRRGRACKDLFT